MVNSVSSRPVNKINEIKSLQKKIISSTKMAIRSDDMPKDVVDHLRRILSAMEMDNEELQKIIVDMTNNSHK